MYLTVMAIAFCFSLLLIVYSSIIIYIAHQASSGKKIDPALVTFVEVIAYISLALGVLLLCLALMGMEFKWATLSLYFVVFAMVGLNLTSNIKKAKNDQKPFKTLSTQLMGLGAVLGSVFLVGISGKKYYNEYKNAKYPSSMF
jgi:hypothetical protein